MSKIRPVRLLTVLLFALLVITLFDYTTYADSDSKTQDMSAQWRSNAVTISYNTQGGSEVDDTTHVYGELSSLAAEPTLDGYDFVGWAESVGGVKVYDASASSSTAFGYANASSHSTKTLYALWQSSKPADLDYLSFTSPNAFTIKANSGKSWDGILEYTLDGSNWVEWDGSEISVPADGTVKMCGTENTKITGNSDSYSWVLTGSNISCTGNIETLIDYQTVANDQHPTMTSYCYAYMFYNCTSLTQAPALPATTLASCCYSSMFEGCTSLKQAPALPAMTLASNCYSSMFDCCTSLKQAPDLPATTLANGCYSCMFNACISLKRAPALPAMTLANGCYEYMFSGCMALTQAPVLPATTLAYGCYYGMFQVTALKFSTSKTGEYLYPYRIPTTGSGTTATSWNANMFAGTSGTFKSNPSINTTYYTTSPPVIKTVAWGSNNAKGLPLGTDAEVFQMIAAADVGIIDLLDYWDIGEKRTVSLSAMAATGVGESHVAQNVELVIVAKDTGVKNNTNPCYNYQYVSPVSGGRSYPTFIIQQKDGLLEDGYMNSSKTNSGSWNASARRTWCNNVYKAALPTVLQSAFKQVKVQTIAAYDGSSMQTSNNYFFLPAAAEVYKGDSSYGTGGSAGRFTGQSNLTEFNNLAKWQYYTTTSNRVKKNGSSGSTNIAWWERSPYYGNSCDFCLVVSRVSSGSAGNSFADNTRLIAPAGCI